MREHMGFCNGPETPLAVQSHKTWERDGVKITLAQAIVGALIAGCVVVTVLVLLVRFATR